jgi:inorganic phosphate transporter, PiT family
LLLETNNAGAPRRSIFNLKPFMQTLLFIVVCLLAYANGANDNFKGVASLYGSGVTGFKTARLWAMLSTLAGCITALFIATTLLKRFSGKGLVPDSLVGSPDFVFAVALGAGITVMLATRLGFPISTTHGLIGGLTGAGLAAVGMDGVSMTSLGKTFLTPLLLSPLLAFGLGAALCLIQKLIGLNTATANIQKVCICPKPSEHPSGSSEVMALSAGSSLVLDSTEACGSVGLVGITLPRLVDGMHFLSAGAVGFARGLNDAPKIAALLLAAGTFQGSNSILAVSVAMAIGGWFGVRRVAETMSHKITAMQPNEALTANISTTLLVTTASFHGLPVSTTHVSVGSLAGMGTVSGKTHWDSLFSILASWVVTLPCAAVCSALAYSLFQVLKLA